MLHPINLGSEGASNTTELVRTGDHCTAGRPPAYRGPCRRLRAVPATARDALLRIACLSAVEAGRLLLRQARCPQIVRRESRAAHLVTEADLAAEAAIRATVLRHRPDDALLGEEHGETSGSSSVRWVIDPLDGTINYVAGIAEWAVSIAVEQFHAGVVAAVVHAPMLGRTYTAVLGGGAWCNGAPLPHRDEAASPLADCVAATGFAADPGRRSVQAAYLARVLPHVRDVRCRGAASLELCAVAAGELDAYFESDLAVWDVAAGRLIAREAGAAVVSPEAGPLTAAREPIARELANLLAAVGAD
jgi:myo-inositol-1(or 4)-monophosphatase